MASTHNPGNEESEAPSLLDKLVAASADSWVSCGRTIEIDLAELFEDRLLRALGLEQYSSGAVVEESTRKRRRSEVELDGEEPEKRPKQKKGGKFSASQVELLMKLFEETLGDATSQQLLDVAIEAELTFAQAQKWFQNRRYEKKREGSAGGADEDIEEGRPSSA
uniref:Homeobox domain-containing protein n=1 Tax=Steinernema glaseri TaxID=37863 RepID=A0A1I7XY38_9BILA